MRPKHFSATNADAVRYYAVGLDEPNMLEGLQFAERLPPESVAAIRRAARERGADLVVVGIAGEDFAAAVVEAGAPVAVAFRAIAEKLGTRFDAGAVRLSPQLAAGIDAFARANSLPAPAGIQ